MGWPVVKREETREAGTGSKGPPRAPAAASGFAFTGIARTNRSQLVREQIEEAIRGGQLKPGQRLPSERELGEILGVSRVSVREAMRSMEALGLVEVHQGRGCFVAEAPGDAYAGSFARWLAAHRDQALELLRVRGALEELAAESAAGNDDPETRNRVRAASEEFRAAAEEASTPLDRLVELDIRFHETIAMASGSSLLVNLLRDLNAHLTEARYAAFVPRGRPLASSREHERIVEAILAGRPGKARMATARHIESVYKLTASAEEER